MSRGNKLERFAQIKTFPNVFEPEGKPIPTSDFRLKAVWGSEYFNNNNPISLELGCGKGEYTTGLAERYPGENFIGIDIKGARMWKGAKYALEHKLANAAFIRARIEFIERLFGKEEIQNIWITFPDPFPKKPARRLSSSFFLNRYKSILKPDGRVHLKTDCRELYNYTLAVLEENGVVPEMATGNLYASGTEHDDALALKTFYELRFLAENKPITYLRFKTDKPERFIEPNRPWG